MSQTTVRTVPAPVEIRHLVGTVTRIRIVEKQLNRDDLVVSEPLGLVQRISEASAVIAMTTGRLNHVPQLLDELNRLQAELPALDHHERLLLKMCANLLESHHQVRHPKNRFTVEEYFKLPGKWEYIDGMLLAHD
jgi:hypothetical protein